MAYCKTCLFYDKRYDEFRQNYDDVIEEGNTQEKHYCVMYEDNIPNKIYYQGAKCPFYGEK